MSFRGRGGGGGFGGRGGRGGGGSFRGRGGGGGGRFNGNQDMGPPEYVEGINDKVVTMDARGLVLSPCNFYGCC